MTGIIETSSRGNPAARVLMVLPSSGRAGDLDAWTGVQIEEFAGPYFLYRDAGLDIVLASPCGGYPTVAPADAAGARHPAAERFARDRRAREELGDTLRLDQVFADDFDGLHVAGGYGALWDLAADDALAALVGALHGAGRPLAMVGYGGAALLRATGADGGSIVRGRRVAAAPPAEEAARVIALGLPFSLPAALATLGARIESGPAGAALIVQDGLLITGQNRESAEGAARALLTALS